MGQLLIASVAYVVATGNDERIRPERCSGIDVPFDLGVASEVELSVDRRSDCRTGIVGNWWHENVREDAGLPPQRVPVAVQAATSGNNQWQAFAQVRPRETVKGLENSVTKDAGEVSEFCVIRAYVIIHRRLKPIIEVKPHVLRG
jgi:hypothetical protein